MTNKLPCLKLTNIYPLQKGTLHLLRQEKKTGMYFKEIEWKLMSCLDGNGSSWYFLRYMDPKNDDEFCAKEKSDYWGQVDLYIGGSEHAVGHLLYSRFWTKFLFDRGFIGFDEPFKKMINQGMILGRSNFVYRIKDTNTFVSSDMRGEL